MAVQYSVAVRDGRNNSDEVVIGASAKLSLRTGAQPASCAAANTGTEVALILLPADWMGASSGGVASKLGTWSVAAATGGTVGHYRLFATDGTTCHEQGSVTNTGGGGDMTLDNVIITAGQIVTIATWSKTQQGA